MHWQPHVARLRLALAEVLRYRAIEPVEGRVWTRLAVNPPILWQTVYDCLRSQRIGMREAEHPRDVFLAGANLLNLSGRMACTSFGLPAGPPRGGGSCPGAATGVAPSHIRYGGPEGWVSVRLRSLVDRGLVDPDTFSCNFCSAMTGQYGSLRLIARSTVIMSWAVRAVADGSFSPVMSRAVERAEDRASHGGSVEAGYFRVHDTGDFFSPEYFDAWTDIAKNLRKIKFLCPTKCYLVSEMQAFVMGTKVPKNLILRPSSPTVGVMEASIGRPFSACTMVAPVADTVGKGVYRCPSTHSPEKTCISDARCRVCWERPDVEIKYAEH